MIAITQQIVWVVVVISGSIIVCGSMLLLASRVAWRIWSETAAWTEMLPAITREIRRKRASKTNATADRAGGPTT